MRLLVLSLMLLIYLPSNAQNDARLAKGLMALEELLPLEMPLLNNKQLLNEELAMRAPGRAPKFAKPVEVDILPHMHGTWEVAENGNAVWRLMIVSKGAKSLNLGFGKYYMPENGTMVLYSPDYETIIGPFSKGDNEVHEQLWTPIVEGDMLVVEVQLPAEEKSDLDLRLDYINHDFLGFMSIASGSCNLDVICGAADGWGIVDNYRDIIRSAATVSSVGSNFCSGFLVNNARQDCTPFYMTADHCGINSGAAASVVVYWNYQNSTCRQPGSAASGGGGDGVFGAFNSGAIRRAGYAPSDFTLLELDDEIPVEAEPYMAGWNAETTLPPADTIIGIHHPSGDEKRISFEFGATYLGNWGSGNAMVPTGNHVIIPDWDIGTTEGGSSGSPIYNSDKQVIGQLHGGGAACGNDSYDSYGWIASSWEGGGTPSTRLKDWLDPDNTGVLSLAGRDCAFSVTPDITFIESCVEGGADAVFTLTAGETFIGDVTLTTANLPMGTSSSFTVNPLMPGQSSVLTISDLLNAESGLYNISVNATDGINNSTTVLTLSLFNGIPEVVLLVEPVDSATGQSTTPSFVWQAAAPGTFYEIQIANDSMFNDVIAMQSGLETNSFNSAMFDPLTTYFWRVRSSNLCGLTDWSEVYSFRTAEIACGPSISSNVPIPITASGTPTIFSTLEVSSGGLISDINVTNLVINHTYVGDLKVELTSPEGTTVVVLDQAGVPAGSFGCDGDNIEVSFDDQSTNPYSDYENACGNAPAISGTFQPIESFTAFNGEDLIGTWTLTVSDNANADGGSLIGWGIDYCASIPLDYSLRVETNPLEVCVNEDVSFDMILGLDFENSIALNALNVPGGTNLTFSNNPVEPGDTVHVDISGGALPADYVISITANDGANSNLLELTYKISDDPTAFELISPVNMETDVAQNVLFTWEASAFVTEYNFQLFSDPDLTQSVLDVNVNSASFTSQPLMLGATYYWTVDALNICDTTSSTSVYSFTVVGDLSYGISPSQGSICTGNDLDFEINIGSGYNNPVVLTYEVSPATNAEVSFTVDPANIEPGSSLTATAFTGTPPAPGNYVINFIIDDGERTESTEVTVFVEGPPNVSTLMAPENGAMNTNLNPVFVWSDVPESNTYLLEIATDAAFNNVIFSQEVNLTTFLLTSELDYNTQYFWAISAENECGGSLSQVFNFTTEMEVSVAELMAEEITIMPNPTNDKVQISFGQYAGTNMQVDLFSVDGKRMSQYLTAGSNELTMDLSEFSNGIYLIRLTNDQGTLTKRVVLQK